MTSKAGVKYVGLCQCFFKSDRHNASQRRRNSYQTVPKKTIQGVNYFKVIVVRLANVKMC